MTKKMLSKLPRVKNNVNLKRKNFGRGFLLKIMEKREMERSKLQSQSGK